MAVILQCARCMHEQKIEDDKVEKGVPCKICHNLIKQGAKGKFNAKAKSSTDAGVKTGPPAAKSNQQTGIVGKKPKQVRDDDDRPQSNKKRRDRDDDDDEDDRQRPLPRRRRQEEGSSNLMFILLGGGAFVLLLFLCGGGGIALYFVASGDAAKNEVVARANLPVENQPVPMNPGPIFKPNPNPGPGPNPFQPPENLDPNDPNKIDRVITLLKGPEQERGQAYIWLKAANPEHPHRAEVAAILESYQLLHRRAADFRQRRHVRFVLPLGDEE